MGGNGGGRDMDFLCRDLEIPLWAETMRVMKLMSRHRVVSRRVTT